MEITTYDLLKEVIKKETITQEEYDKVVECNLLGVSLIEIMDIEEEIGKKLIIDLYVNKFELLNNMNLSCMKSIIEIHKMFFSELYIYAGKIRNISSEKDGFPFLPHRYMNVGIEYFDNLECDTLDEIIRKYVEYNFLHPFFEGNGRVGRVWLDALIYRKLNSVISWGRIPRNKYLRLMHESRINPDNYVYLMGIFKENLISLEECNFDVIFRGTDISYAYEGFTTFKLSEIYDTIKINEITEEELENLDFDFD